MAYFFTDDLMGPFPLSRLIRILLDNNNWDNFSEKSMQASDIKPVKQHKKPKKVNQIS